MVWLYGAKHPYHSGAILWGRFWGKRIFAAGTSFVFLPLDRSTLLFENQPIVTDWKNHYFAGSFEKYLFQKVFYIYQEKFEHKSSVGTSINSCDALLKKHSFPCSFCGGTAEEKMKFVRWLVNFLELHEKETWFSDELKKRYMPN